MRKPFLMSKDEKKIWGMLSKDEQATWEKCSIFLAFGGIFAIVGLFWLAFFTPSSEILEATLLGMLSVGIIFMLASMSRYASVLRNKLARK